MHCKLPFAMIPIRSHKTSASSIECAENRFKQCFHHLIVNLMMTGEVKFLLVRIIVLSCFADLTAFHKFFLDAGSKPELGSSI